MTPQITLEEVARMPRPGWSIPGMLAFSPDDRLITYLHSPEGGLVRQLYAYNLETRERSLLVSPPGEAASEENLSLEEKLRRERARQLELGVTAYAWAPEGTRLLVPFPDGLYVQDGLNEPLRKVVDAASGGIVIDPRFSPDGEWIAYVQDSELWVVPAQGGEPAPADQRCAGKRAHPRAGGIHRPGRNGPQPGLLVVAGFAHAGV